MDRTFIGKNVTKFTGRNGRYNMIGWDIPTTRQSVIIIPITSRNKSAVCDIEIHKDDLDTFIEHLTDLNNHLKTTTCQST